jgi:hypothetical protein
MTCQHCGKASLEGTRPSTAAWCVDCQKALLAPPESFLNCPRVDVTTRGNAKWEYSLQVPGQTGWRVIEVKVHKPGTNYRVMNPTGVGYQTPEYVPVDRLHECLWRIAESTLIEARARLVDARVTLEAAQTYYKNAQQLVDLLSSGKEATADVPDFWERLHGVESDHGNTDASEMATGEDRRE